MNKTTLNSQKEKHSMLSLRRATRAVTVPDNGLAFLSTLSLRRATSRVVNTSFGALFLSTLSLRRATLLPYGAWRIQGIFLSTLSLRRATIAMLSGVSMLCHFYPRSPCGERPLPAFHPKLRRYFYPRSPCGERLCIAWVLDCWPCISIHALLAESDSTSPTLCVCALISIHALLAESD